MDTPGWGSCHSPGRGSSDVAEPFVMSQSIRFLLNCLRTHFLESWWIVHWVLSHVGAWGQFISLQSCDWWSDRWADSRQSLCNWGQVEQSAAAPIVSGRRFSVDLYVNLSSRAGVWVKKKKTIGSPALHQLHQPQPKPRLIYSAQPPQPHSKTHKSSTCTTYKRHKRNKRNHWEKKKNNLRHIQLIIKGPELKENTGVECG